ncbi:hypothetical protein [uncultured Devosia sp.]|uniref:hypothetical protein n=1 Tax=uncultured Devosia sp. TaxID=211434 RepID=UPI0030EF944F|tara:strand:+ start:306 stop:1568 length:1263 start_codon:yes stop_codon:yes gene_type:complete
MDQRRFGQSNGTSRRVKSSPNGRGRGTVEVILELPKFVIVKHGKIGPTFYWNPPVYWRKRAALEGRSYPFESQKLGSNLSQSELQSAANPHNALFEEWRLGKTSTPSRTYAAHGTVEWLFEQYQASTIFKRRVSVRSRPDYARVFNAIANQPTKTGGRFGQLPVASVTPAAAEKIYVRMLEGDTFRRGEKAVMYCKTAWRLMQPHHPREFGKDVPNPWVGVQLVKRAIKSKNAINREEVYTFAWAAVGAGKPEAAAAAIICFEWLQRPENVVYGYISWSDYKPNVSIRIEHHKTGEMLEHPLSDGSLLFYPEAEEILSLVPKRAAPIVMGEGKTEPYKGTRFAQIVRKIADQAGLPKTFTLDACRHGGMTELEEAGLTDGQGRALSAHKSRAYERYAKRTAKRMLAATTARFEHRSNESK